MALRLGDILVGRGLITRDQLQDALLAQRQFGGRLGSNLVEMGFVGEDQLAVCLSEQLGVPWVQPHALAAIPRDVIALVPPEMAQKYRVVPWKHDLELHLCLADPHNFERLDELSFALGCRIRPYVVTEVSLNYALERYYGIRREIRYLTPAALGINGPRGSSPSYTDLPAMDGLSAFGSTSSVIEDLAGVMTEDDVMRTVVRYFTELFDHTVLLSAADGSARPVLVGARASCRPAPAGLALSPTPGSLLHGVLTRPQVLHRAHVTDRELQWLWQQLNIPLTNLTLFPVIVGTRTTHVVIAQGRDEASLRESFSGIRKFLAKVSHALHIVALRNEIRAA